MMGFRKLRAKKYKGIQEYYKNSDPNKKTIAHYISYWANGTGKKERIDTLDPNEALKILNERKAEQMHRRENHEDLTSVGAGALLTIDQVATEYFKERKKIGNIERDMKRYCKHIGNRIYETIDIKDGRGWKLTDKTRTYDAHLRSGIVTRKYERDSDSFSVGDIIIKDLESNTLKRLINTLEKKGLGAKTRSAIMNLLKAIVNHAVSEGYITANPFSDKKTHVEVPKEERKRLFTPQELKEIFLEAKRTDPRVFMLFKMLYYTGQRPESIIKLRVIDIDMKQRKISIDAIKDQSGTFVPISDKLFPLMKIWLKGCSPEQRLFNIGYDTFQAKAQKIFKKYNRGLKYKEQRYQWASMYTFRHTAATVMLAKTGNIKTVQTVLNHSDPKVTAIYAKLLEDAKKDGVNVL